MIQKLIQIYSNKLIHTQDNLRKVNGHSLDKNERERWIQLVEREANINEFLMQLKDISSQADNNLFRFNY